MLNRENKAGLYLTIAVHLLAIIILLATKIGTILKEETSFVLDFTKQEEQEKKEEEVKLKEDVSHELDDILAGKRPSNIRNVVVDAGATKGSELKDDRFRNSRQVYDEAKELQKKLDASKKEAEAFQGSDDIAPASKQETSKPTVSYKGPSVLSYTLDGRKAMSLPIPVYKCLGGGDVYVTIQVNRKGYVIYASIVSDVSANDNCIREYALRAAKSSRFTASATAPEKQTGEIVYRFIAQ